VNNGSSQIQVVLGLGSNLGDSRQIIFEAIIDLKEVLTKLRTASFYETKPLYVEDQNRFVNTAVAGYYTGSEDSLSAGKLLQSINRIEERFGRDRSRERRWGERLLDIDILLFGNLKIREAALEIPHPRLKERRFALQPLLELLPDASEPCTGLSYRSVCEALSDQGVTLLPERIENM